MTLASCAIFTLVAGPAYAAVLFGIFMAWRVERGAR